MAPLRCNEARQRVVVVMRILVVEDERVAAEVLAKGSVNAAVDIAWDGATALEQAGTNDYDLIVLDVLIPRIDGVELCRRLRASGLAVPVLMLTARGEPISGSKVSTPAPTITCRSLITFPSYSRACVRCSAAGRRSRRRSFPAAICPSTLAPGASSAAVEPFRSRRRSTAFSSTCCAARVTWSAAPSPNMSGTTASIRCRI